MENEKWKRETDEGREKREKNAPPNPYTTDPYTHKSIKQKNRKKKHGKRHSTYTH